MPVVVSKQYTYRSRSRNDPAGSLNLAIAADGSALSSVMTRFTIALASAAVPYGEGPAANMVETVPAARYAAQARIAPEIWTPSKTLRAPGGL